MSTDSPNSVPPALDVVYRYLLRHGRALVLGRVSVRPADADWARQLLRLHRMPGRCPIVSFGQRLNIDRSYSEESGRIFAQRGIRRAKYIRKLKVGQGLP